MENKIWTYW